MATKNDRNKGKNKQSVSQKSLGCLFWIAFALLITAIILINKPILEKNLNKFFASFKDSSQTDVPASEPRPATEPLPKTIAETAPEQTAPDKPLQPVTVAKEKPRSKEGPIVVPTQDTPKTPPPSPPAATTTGAATTTTGAAPSSPPAATTTTGAAPSSPPAATTGAATPSQEAPTPRPKADPRESAKPDLRSRNLWMVKLDRDGTIVRTKVARKLPATDSPLKDVLETLLAGPSGEEKKKGIDSLIPENTRLLYVTVRGSTAYISLSEDFQFNTYGIEGYAAQLRQIVWTACEFPTVKDVQILIEGKRIDYLGFEGIFIGSPLSKNDL